MSGPDSTRPLRIAWFYDLDACRGPTGVTRHALAQRDQLAARPERVELSAVTGHFTAPEGRAYWQRLDPGRRHRLPLRTRDALRWWRNVPIPPIEAWTGAVDWVYCPAELYVPTRRARRAVTSHDVLQDLQYGGPRRRRLLDRVFGSADRILSVSRFNTDRLLESFPACAGKLAEVPNAAEELFFEPAAPAERVAVRNDLGLPDGVPYLLSVANFQPRKNLDRLVEAVARLSEAAVGDLALVLVGDGSPDQRSRLDAAIAAASPRLRVVRPGYREGAALRALYAEATALVFPSLCESFGIPVVEAMAQRCPVAIADSTALPEIAGAAGWPFDATDPAAIAAALRALLDQPAERTRRVVLGRTIAARYRWSAATDRLLAALAE